MVHCVYTILSEINDIFSYTYYLDKLIHKERLPALLRAEDGLPQYEALDDSHTGQTIQKSIDDYPNLFSQGFISTNISKLWVFLVFTFFGPIWPRCVTTIHFKPSF